MTNICSSFFRGNCIYYHTINDLRWNSDLKFFLPHWWIYFTVPPPTTQCDQLNVGSTLRMMTTTSQDWRARRDREICRCAAISTDWMTGGWETDRQTENNRREETRLTPRRGRNYNIQCEDRLGWMAIKCMRRVLNLICKVRACWAEDHFVSLVLELSECDTFPLWSLFPLIVWHFLIINCC